MAAIMCNSDIDLAALRSHLAARLPDYARPLFLRIRHEVDVTATFKQRNQDFQSPAAERYGPVALPQEKLHRKQAERSERHFDRSGAGRNSSFLEEWPVRIRSLNGASHVESRFGIKLRQASENCSRS